MRGSFKIALILTSVAGVAVGGLAIGDQVRVRVWIHQLRSADGPRRISALTSICDARDQRAAVAVRRLIDGEQDRSVLESAAYTAMRLGDIEAVGSIRRRADARPDDSTRAKLIQFAARLADRDVRLIEWLHAGIGSQEPWRRIGSALGLLELCEPDGGRLLIEMAPQLDAEMAGFTAFEFQRIAEPMTQSVGQPLTAWPSGERMASWRTDWGHVGDFWRRSATVDLLADVLGRLERFDASRREVDRLLHARERVARWLQ